MKSGSLELWRTMHNWLSILGNKVNIKYCKDEMETHPDYPAMTAAIDFLDAGGMSYQAVQADASYFNEFNYPLIAHIQQPGNEYLHVIEERLDWEKQKEITQYWSGVVLFADKNTKWNNAENNQLQIERRKTRVISTALICMGIVIFIFSITELQSVAINIFGFLSLTGLVISVFALGTERNFHFRMEYICASLTVEAMVCIMPWYCSSIDSSNSLCGIITSCINTNYYCSISSIYMFIDCTDGNITTY